MDKKILSKKLIAWYEENKRDLPWRHTNDPYKIWLSEIILQQTRVVQGTPYYEKFVANYPTVQELANAPEQEVLRLWQGLGYYSRARNLHFTAKYISNELQNQFPKNYKELLTLKGVGNYTAAAIASFAYDESVAAVDGNVFRVLSRLFNVDLDIASSQGKKAFEELAQEIIPKKNAGTHNQAMIEFGALHCTPQKPNCMFCTFQQACEAFRLGKQNQLPVKIKKVKVRKRYFDYLVWEFDNQFLLKERQAGDIWQGLHDFHLIESSKENSDWENLLSDLGIDELAEKSVLINQSKVYKHILSHQNIFAQFHRVEIQTESLFEQIANQFNLSIQPKEQLQEIPKPILINNYLEESVF
jgi:A/G-specific adenine glycosylase